jgi:hypothetical protein
MKKKKPKQKNISVSIEPLGNNKISQDHKSLHHMRIKDINGKAEVFRNVDFSYSIITRGYFHKAKFINCKFVGTRFVDCIFRSATFNYCDFQYADFVGTIISTEDIFSNLPSYPNTRRGLLQSLRKNAVSIGDYEAEKKIVIKEIEAKKEHLRAARKLEGEYYQKKYAGWKNQAFVCLKSVGLWLENLIWGHGEKLFRFPIFLLIWSTILSFLHLFLTPDLFSLSVGQASGMFTGTYKSVLLGLINVEAAPPRPFTQTINILIEVTKYLIWGMVAATLYRRLSHR